MDLLVHMAQGAVGAWLALRILRWIDKRRDPNPYKWGCPQCSFHVESNSAEFTLDLANNHEMRHTE